MSQNFVTAIDPAHPPAGLEGAVVAIGNFDGVHRGHAAVIARAAARAHALGRPCAVLTFEPHPADFFQGAGTVFRLTPDAAKADALARLGLDGMIVFTFDAALAALSAEDFVREILVRRLGVSAVIAGYDFHFGSKRGGTPAFLRDAGARHGFAVEIVERVTSDASGDIEAASSTATRTALEQGDVAHAASLLGHPFTMQGEVVGGQKLGRTIGFPTANIRPDPTCRLRYGIYAVRASVEGKTHAAVASFGRRPTVDNGAALLEVFLFDFDGDLYGKTMDVAFVAWIRGEEKFSSLEVLTAQIARDAADAREILSR